MAADQFARLRREFGHRHCIILPQLFSSGLVRMILQQIESAQFYRNSHRDHLAQEFAWDLTIRENEMALHLIHFLLNNPRVFRAIQEITGCPEIGSFGGRIYRSLPNNEHRLDWHDDRPRRTTVGHQHQFEHRALRRRHIPIAPEGIRGSFAR